MARYRWHISNRMTGLSDVIRIIAASAKGANHCVDLPNAMDLVRDGGESPGGCCEERAD
jgi:hypothetical protein